MDSRTIEIGQIYKIKADERNDITPKAGMPFRPKYFVVVGFDNQGNVYGGVVFDSEINRDFVSPDFEDFFLPISCSKYDFCIIRNVILKRTVCSDKQCMGLCWKSNNVKAFVGSMENIFIK